MSSAELLRGLYEAFGRGDVPTVLGAMHPEIRWHQAEGQPYQPDGTGWVGPETVLNRLFVRLANEWNGFTVTPHAFHDAGDTVVVEGRYTGEYPPTGASIDAQFCHVWSLADGKITRFRQYTDTAQFQEVMGTKAVPAP